MLLERHAERRAGARRVNSEIRNPERPLAFVARWSIELRAELKVDRWPQLKKPIEQEAMKPGTWPIS
jgi:hypothetical protein